MKSSHRLIALALMLVVTGCATSFREPRAAEPHAVLKFEGRPGVGGALGAQDVVPLEINGLPPESWTRWNLRSFRVSPGPVTLLLRVQEHGSVEGMLDLEFNAVAGKTYVVSSQSEARYFVVTVLDDDEGLIVADGRAGKEASVRSTESQVPIFIPTN